MRRDLINQVFIGVDLFEFKMYSLSVQQIVAQFEVVYPPVEGVHKIQYQLDLLLFDLSVN